MTFAVSRPVKRRARIRAFNDETAHQALTAAGWGHNREAFGFNKGQFSIFARPPLAVIHTLQLL